MASIPGRSADCGSHSGAGGAWIGDGAAAAADRLYGFDSVPGPTTSWTPSSAANDSAAPGSASPPTGAPTGVAAMPLVAGAGVHPAVETIDCDTVGTGKEGGHLINSFTIHRLLKPFFSATYHQLATQLLQFLGRRGITTVASPVAPGTSLLPHSAPIARDEIQRAPSILSQVLELSRKCLDLRHSQAELLLLFAEQRPDRIQVVAWWSAGKRDWKLISLSLKNGE